MAALLFFVFIFVATPSLINSEECNLLVEFDAYLTQFFNKFSTDSYEKIYCLDVALYGYENRCKRSIFARSVKTSYCDTVRKNKNEALKHLIFDMYSYHPTAKSFENFLYSRDIDAEFLCKAMNKFNKIPKCDRSKKDYANIFNSTVKYVAFHWVNLLVSDHHQAFVVITISGNVHISVSGTYDVEGCYFDIIKAIAKFLNVPAPYSWKCLMNFSTCPNKINYLDIAD